MAPGSVDGAPDAEEGWGPYRRLFEASHNPHWVHDLETLRLVAVNEAVVRDYGWSREELLSMSLPDLLLPEDEEVPGGPASAGAVAVDVRPLRKVRTKDRRILTVAILSYVVHFEGRPCEFTAAQDVSDVQSTRERLQILTSAMDQSPVSIAITDTTGAIEFVNPQFCRSSGWEPEEVLGRNMRILRSGAHSPEFYAGLWRTVKSGTVWRGEIRNKRKDGSLYWERVTIAPVADDRGRVMHFVALKEDVTEKKSLEEQFRQAQKMEAVGRLAGGVAHDFNNLLMVINGYAEMAAGRLGADDPVRSHVEEVRKAGARAAELTRQLLAFSRKQVLQPRPVDLNRSIEGMEKMLRRLLGEDVALETRLDPALGAVIVDPGQFEQAVMNLCVNARDAMPSGGTLVLATGNRVHHPEGPDGTRCGAPVPCACVEVTDDGVGMGPEVREHLFEPFFTTKPLGRGTGLGLPMVYGFTAQSGGFLEVDSEPGRGSTFRILLPRTGCGDGPPLDPPPALPSRRGSETILVVEDEPAVATVARCALENVGYRVLEADGVEDAVRVSAEHPGDIDLLLTDVILPGKNGRQAAEECRLLRPGLPVLYMSGYTDDVIGRHGVLEKGIDLLNKPFLPSALCDKVREILDRSPA
jgi:two-component system cell cycle sensor histidine kinase/response regulator CckA